METPASLQGVECFVFDLMGTCTDWHSSITTAMHKYPLPAQLSEAELPKLALEWRSGFFKYILNSFAAGEESPSIDEVHTRVLDEILSARGIDNGVWNQHIRERLVDAWHDQKPWPDSVPGLEGLKKRAFIVVLANGTTRLQLDIVRSSGLPFHTLFSSQLLQATKPSPRIYQKALELLGLNPSQVAMVAAHAYDLRAAAQVGLRTVYIRRTTEDPEENMEQIEREVDIFIDGRDPQGGLLRLATLWDSNH